MPNYPITQIPRTGKCARFLIGFLVTWVFSSFSSVASETALPQFHVPGHEREMKLLGVIWDSANLSPTPDPYAQLERIAPYAVTAQVKVMTKVNGEDTPADYARLVKILREANYRGYLIFEYEEDEDPYTAIPKHLPELRRLIS